MVSARKRATTWSGSCSSVKRPCNQALRLGQQSLGFAAGLISQRRRLGVPYPDRAVAGA